MNTKKTRRSLSDLHSQLKSNEELLQPLAKPKQKKQLQKTENTQPPNLLDKLKTQKPEKITRITVDLDPETYEQLEQLIEYTGLTKAKLLRALIKDTANLLQKNQ
jgi:hypothetical protein